MTAGAIPSADQGFVKSSVLAAQDVHRSITARARIEASASMERSFQLHLADGSLVINVTGEEPDWLYKVLDAIQQFSFLPIGWDSYDGKPLTIMAAFESLKFLEQMLQSDSPAPSVVPGSTGGLQLEWHRFIGDLEVCFSRDGRMSASFASASGDEAWEMESEDIDLATLHGVVAHL